MGFMDKAKKMAEQAQTKLDEVQKQFNEGQGERGASPPAQEYDQHGRPVGPRVGGPDSSTPPHGDPLTERKETAAAPPQPDPAAPAPSEAATPPHGDPLTGESARDDDDPHAPPKLSGGDPLAG